MATLIHADIFFFVTTVAVIVIGIAFTIVLLYIANVLRQLRDVIKEVKEETVLVREDLGRFRSNVRQEGWKVKSLVDAALSIFKFKKSKRK
jgi:uncharacterized protein YoxC